MKTPKNQPPALVERVQATLQQQLKGKTVQVSVFVHEELPVEQLSGVVEDVVPFSVSSNMLAIQTPSGLVYVSVGRVAVLRVVS